MPSNLEDPVGVESSRRLAQTNGFVEDNGVGRTFDFMLGRNVLPHKYSSKEIFKIMWV